MKYSWTDTVYKAFSKSFTRDYGDDALSFLLKCIKDEFRQAKKDENSLEKLYACIGDFYKHFCWKINWKRDSLCSMKKSCVIILSYLIKTGVLLSRGKLSSKWINNILAAMKIFPGPLELMYDSLILINNVKKKCRSSFTAVLNHFLFTNKLKVSKSEDYFKVMLLLKTVKFLSENKLERAKVVTLALKIHIPSDVKSWLLSHGIENLTNVNNKLFSKVFLNNKKLPQEFFVQLRNALRIEVQIKDFYLPNSVKDSFVVGTGINNECEFTIENTAEAPIIKNDAKMFVDSSSPGISLVKRKRKKEKSTHLSTEDSIDSSASVDLSSSGTSIIKRKKKKKDRLTNTCTEDSIDSTALVYPSSSSASVVKRKKDKINSSTEDRIDSTALIDLSSPGTSIVKRKKKKKDRLTNSSTGDSLDSTALVDPSSSSALVVKRKKKDKLLNSNIISIENSIDSTALIDFSSPGTSSVKRKKKKDMLTSSSTEDSVDSTALVYPSSSSASVVKRKKDKINSSTEDRIDSIALIDLSSPGTSIVKRKKKKKDRLTNSYTGDSIDSTALVDPSSSSASVVKRKKDKLLISNIISIENSIDSTALIDFSSPGTSSVKRKKKKKNMLTNSSTEDSVDSTALVDPSSSSSSVVKRKKDKLLNSNITKNRNITTQELVEEESPILPQLYNETKGEVNQDFFYLSSETKEAMSNTFSERKIKVDSCSSNSVNNSFLIDAEMVNQYESTIDIAAETALVEDDSQMSVDSSFDICTNIPCIGEKRKNIKLIEPLDIEENSESNLILKDFPESDNEVVENNEHKNASSQRLDTVSILQPLNPKSEAEENKVKSNSDSKMKDNQVNSISSSLNPEAEIKHHEVSLEESIKTNETMHNSKRITLSEEKHTDFCEKQNSKLISSHSTEDIPICMCGDKKEESVHDGKNKNLKLTKLHPSRFISEDLVKAQPIVGGNNDISLSNVEVVHDKNDQIDNVEVEVVHAESDQINNETVEVEFVCDKNDPIDNVEVEVVHAESDQINNETVEVEFICDKNDPINNKTVEVEVVHDKNDPINNETVEEEIVLDKNNPINNKTVEVEVVRDKNDPINNKTVDFSTECSLIGYADHFNEVSKISQINSVSDNSSIHLEENINETKKVEYSTVYLRVSKTCKEAFHVISPERLPKNLAPETSENELSNRNFNDSIDSCLFGSDKQSQNTEMPAKNKEASPNRLGNYIEGVLYKLVDEVVCRINNKDETSKEESCQLNLTPIESSTNDNINKSEFFSFASNSCQTFSEISKQTAVDCKEYNILSEAKSNLLDYRGDCSKLEINQNNAVFLESDCGIEDTENISDNESLFGEHSFDEYSQLHDLEIQNENSCLIPVDDCIQSKCDLSFQPDEAASSVAKLPCLSAEVGCDYESTSDADCAERELTQESEVGKLFIASTENEDLSFSESSREVSLKEPNRSDFHKNKVEVENSICDADNNELVLNVSKELLEFNGTETSANRNSSYAGVFSEKVLQPVVCIKELENNCDTYDELKRSENKENLSCVESNIHVAQELEQSNPQIANDESSLPKSADHSQDSLKFPNDSIEKDCLVLEYPIQGKDLSIPIGHLELPLAVSPVKQLRVLRQRKANPNNPSTSLNRKKKLKIDHSDPVLTSNLSRLTLNSPSRTAPAVSQVGAEESKQQSAKFLRKQKVDIQISDSQPESNKGYNLRSKKSLIQPSKLKC